MIYFSKLQTGIQLQKVLKSEYTFKLYNLIPPLCPIISAQLQTILCKLNPIGGGGKKQLHIRAYNMPKAEKCVFSNFMCIVVCYYYLTSAIWSVTTAKPLLTSRWQFASVFSDSFHIRTVYCVNKESYIYITCYS